MKDNKGIGKRSIGDIAPKLAELTDESYLAISRSVKIYPGAIAA